jgi:hypothetical protein
MIEAFIRELDHELPSARDDKLELKVIGSSALFLQCDYDRGTKDSDILETTLLKEGARDQLLTLAGQGTALHQRHKLYLEFVPQGLPFLPQQPCWNVLTELNSTLVRLRLSALDIVDVVVSKLKRFNANDRQDIEAMIERELAPHDRVVARFREAIDFNSMSSMADDFPVYVRNLNQVERDAYLVAETKIELPGWI